MSVFSQASVIASPPSVELPIYSADVARNAMLDLSVQGSVYYTSASIDWGYQQTAYYTNVTGTNAEDVLAKLGTFEYNLRITNPNDDIQAYEYVNDAAGNNLFFGYIQFPQTNNRPLFQLWLENIVLPGAGVSSATVLVLNPDGTTANQNPLNIQNGEILFSPYMIGAPNGLLVEDYSNGGVSTIPLAKPIPQTIGAEQGDATFKIQGHYVLKDPTNTVQIIEAYNLPTAFLQVTSKAVSQNGITWDVTGLVQTSDGGTYFDRPLTMVITPEGSNAGAPWSVSCSQTGPTNVQLPFGTFRIYFTWARFGQPGLLYTGSTMVVGTVGGGK
jgi:hypothetical protein